jgi:hypothetical protein
MSFRILLVSINLTIYILLFEYFRIIRDVHRYLFHNQLYSVPLFVIPLNAKTFGIRDQGKPYSGAWLQGSKRNGIPDPMSGSATLDK